MALIKKIKNIFKKEKKKLKPDSQDIDPMDAFMEEWINETNQKKKDLIIDHRIKKNSKGIKKRFFVIELILKIFKL